MYPALFKLIISRNDLWREEVRELAKKVPLNNLYTDNMSESLRDLE